MRGLTEGNLIKIIKKKHQKKTHPSMPVVGPNRNSVYFV